jgi:hypothetical protein
MNGSAPLPVAWSKCATVSGVFVQTYVTVSKVFTETVCSIRKHIGAKDPIVSTYIDFMGQI